MANPSYSSDNISFMTLPGKYRYGGEPFSWLDDFEIKETENGGIIPLLMSRRAKMKIKFRVTKTELIDHANLDFAYTGMAIPFYFSISGVGTADAILVRKMSPYNPQELETPVKVGGTLTTMFDLEYELIGEIF